MPGRELIFTDNGIYHVFNKTIDKKVIFTISRHSKAFLDILQYYRSSRSTRSFSRLKSLSNDMKNSIIQETKDSKYFRVQIIAFCLMPTHFHLLMAQKMENGVQKVMTDVMNSFTRYYNILHQRKGPLFLPRFRAVSVTSDAQLMHVSRYIHLNPYSSGLIANKDFLEIYPYSSYSDYISEDQQNLIENNKVMELFQYNAERYKNFVLDHAEHQQMLEQVKYSYEW